MKDIRKDKLHEVNIFDGEKEVQFMVNARYDRIDHYAPLGIWIIKIMDDERGMIEGICSEEYARNLAKTAMLPIIDREFIFESEHEMYIDATSQRLDDIFGAND